MFGLDPKTAIRYAENARLLLTTRAEEQDPASSREPKDPNDSLSMKILRFIVKTLSSPELWGITGLGQQPNGQWR